MARKNGPPSDDHEGVSRYGSGRAEVEDYSAARSEFDAGEALDSARMPDLEPDQESPFLRAQKRVPVRRGPLPKKTAHRLKFVAIVAAVIAVAVMIVFAADRYGMKSWRFRIESSDQIQVSGNQNVPRAQILEAFGGDISRNVFAVPLDGRKKQLEQIPWIQSATVMRHLPNRVAVVVKERTPIAFVQVGPRIALIDASGVVMEMPQAAATKYSFPVIVGFTEAEPLSTRAARMKMYTALLHDLDSGGERYSQDLSEVELSDPEDAKVTVADAGVVVHLGNSNYLDRYKVYVSHVQEWKQQFGTLKSVDLRYDGQVVVDPGTPPQTTVQKQPATSKPAATAPVTAKSRDKVLGQWDGSAPSSGVKASHKVTPVKHARVRKRKRR